MVEKVIVEKINKNKGFYTPHISTNIPSFAAIPEELIDKIEIGDEVTIFSRENLSYGGFSAIVIETPRAKLENRNFIKKKKDEKINMQFTWSSDKEDEDLYKNGVILIWVAGRTKAIQKFVEALSYRIGSKCDFSFAAGRAHIDIYKDAKERALEAINDEEFMNQFIVPYSQESYNNETYFEILH